MNDKERAAMQQAIEFIVDCEYGKAELALREALEHSGKANEFEPDWDGTLGLVEEIKRLAIENERLRHGEIKYEDWEFNPMTGESLLVENHGQELVAGVVEANKEWGIAAVVSDGIPIGTKLYAAPVRTKDLTDDEIMKINVDTAGIVPTCDRQFHFARAVIAADREKNK